MIEATTSEGRYTWDDFVALDEDDLRELIDGELVEVEAPTKAHERIAFPESFEGLAVDLAPLWKVADELA
jgi:Uma2 family endonuclease